LTEQPASAQEWRIVAREGVVRVYRPEGFRARGAALAIYVHGLYTDVDRAWVAHRLPEQFDASLGNALFVVPAARSAGPDALPWPDLGALLAVVSSETGQALPPGPLVAAGHSGAYKQIGGWLHHPRLRAVLLLDGLYGAQAEFRAWLDARPGNRMALVSRDTAAAVARWTRDIPYTVRRARCPADVGLLSPRERAAKLLAMGTDTDHFGMVTDGKILPLLLQWSGLPTRP
jgi:hypothetical protein